MRRRMVSDYFVELGVESGPPAERATFEQYSQPDFKFLQQICRAHTILHENEAFYIFKAFFFICGLGRS